MNEKYINDFSEEQYLYILKNKSNLKEIADSYLNQYENPTYDETIIFKESLDHYIVKKINTDLNFKNSNEFKNYLIYINYIVKNRKNNNYLLELNTNVVFKNEIAKQTILNMYSEKDRIFLNNSINNVNIYIQSLNNKLINDIRLSNEELKFLCDYLYTSRDNTNNIYENLIHYLLNEKNVVNVNFSNEIAAAYISYMPKIYGNNCEDARIVLSNGYGSMGQVLPSKINAKNPKCIGPYNNSDKYVSFDYKYLKNIKLDSYFSLDVSRTFKDENRDLYWLSMICFHELTHRVQFQKSKSINVDSSGLSRLFRELCDLDYGYNHDSFEMEIEADEISWKTMQNFILKYRKNKDNRQEQYHKAILNEKAVFSRRAFLSKKNVANDDYFKQDIDTIQKLLSMSPEESKAKFGYVYKSKFDFYYNNHPMLRKVFSPDGKIDTSVIFENIGSYDNSAVNTNIMGAELANYIFMYGFSKVKEHVVNDNLSVNQIKSLLLNMYNTYYLSKTTVRELNKVDLSQYNETNHNVINGLNEESILDKYFYHFYNVANMVYKEREIISILKNRYPNFDLNNIYDSKFCYFNFNEMLDYLLNKDINSKYYNQILDVCTLYETSGDEILILLAQETKNKLGYVNINDNQTSFKTM